MASRRNRRLDCEVLVVGAGPTGLMSALLLKRRGVEVRIVEKRARPSRESRAFAVQARTLELLESLGLEQPLLKRGVINSGIDFFVGGKRMAGLEFDRANAPDTPFQFLLMVPQAKTEAVLIEALTACDVHIEREVEVLDVVDEGDRVFTTVSAHGHIGSIESAYVIGADGAHSLVRTKMGVSFEGAAYPQSFLLADCRVDWRLDHDRFRIFVKGERIGLFLPLDGSSVSRIMAVDQSHPSIDDLPPKPLEIEEVEASFSDAACQPVSLSHPIWTTRYRTHRRGVDRYRKGRMFVAGDAAHIHSPAGGQGMNTGLQDAANLAWKLAAVLRHGATDPLLDTYECERLPVGQETVAFTDRLFSIAAGQSGWRAWLRDLCTPPIANRLFQRDFVQQRAFRKLSELGIAYPFDSLSPHAAIGSMIQPSPGQRAPDAIISRSVRMFELLAGYRWTVLALSRRSLDRAESSRIAGALQELRLDAPIIGYLIARISAGGDDPQVIHAERAQVFEHYGLDTRSAQALFVVRPDGYIAWRRETFDFGACRDYFRQMTPNPSTQPPMDPRSYARRSPTFIPTIHYAIEQPDGSLSKATDS